MGVAQMKDCNRRTAIGALAAGLAMPLLGAPLKLAARGQPIAFPARPVLLSRELERDLGQHESVLVVRTWDCSFAQIGAGAAIAAKQVASRVTAPPALAALAEIERDRKVSGLFPMQLDRAGLIVGWPDEGKSGIEPAVAHALERLEALDLSHAEDADARRYFAEIGKTAAALVSQVPRDLFFPAEGRSSDKRAMTLPDGTSGSYEVTIEARAKPSSGLLDYSEKRIVTRIGGSERTARERWSIA